MNEFLNIMINTWYTAVVRDLPTSGILINIIINVAYIFYSTLHLNMQFVCQ